MAKLQTMHLARCHMQGHGADHNALYGLHTGWNFYSGMPLQPTNYQVVLSSLTNYQLIKDGILDVPGDI